MIDCELSEFSVGKGLLVGMDYEANPNIPSGVRPLVDPEAHGEVDPTR